MRTLAAVAAALAIPLLLPHSPPDAARRARSRRYELRGGWWLADSTFVRRRMFVVDDLLTTRRPAVVDSVIELGDRYVVPPFADAHTHLLTNPASARAESDRLLADGIFGVLSLTGSAAGRHAAAGRVNVPDAVDVAYADALTSTRGHPILSAEVSANRIPWDSLQKYWPTLLHSHRAEGDVYFTIDSLADLERKWPRLRANVPDLVKIYLFDSEHFDSLSRDTTSIGTRGLDPALVPAIVARAHRDSLRVAAHVETAADFRIAVRAGVDIVAHLPGLAPRADEPAARYQLTAADAADARRAGTAVVLTAWLAERLAAPKPWLGSAGADIAQLRRAQQIQRASIAELQRVGVPMAIGSDLFGTAITEALYLEHLGTFDRRTLLHMLVATTPHLVFPTRHVGRLVPGDEASLLVLGCNPLQRLECVRTPSFRMKQGVVLRATST